MDPANILKIITNSTWMVTRLISRGPVQFQQDVYHVEVTENKSPGPILQLTVSVSTNNEPVLFRVKEGDPENLFGIDHSTGKLVTLTSLDYEKAQKYDLVIEARLGQETTEAHVIVSIRDTNDHEPSFFRQKYETQITEEDDRHLPKKILTVSAQDGDSEEFGLLTYNLTGLGTISASDDPFFTIDNDSGALYVLKPLNRDPPDGIERWALEVTATDGASTATTTITVNVKDVNDNVPYFDQDVVHATVPENAQEGEEVITMHARDNDDINEGSNAVVNYSLEKNVIDEKSGRPLFTVNGSTGRVTTSLCCLDREQTSQYAIQVVATDGGGLKGTGTIIVEIGDENDISPKFTEREWNFVIPEELPDDDIIASLTVADKDITNDFAYKIVPGSGQGWQFFAIQGEGHVAFIKSKTLDFEDPIHRQGFRFFVQVSDSGEQGFQTESHTDGTWINFELQDVNDNMPKFIKATTYHPQVKLSPAADKASVELEEDADKNIVIASFKTEDHDQEGQGPVTFSIDPDTDPSQSFQVDDSGTVRLTGNLDRETIQSYNLHILAHDSGDDTLTSTATLKVTVKDVNDNAPHLVESSTYYVTKGQPPQQVGRFHLSDPDDWELGHGPPFALQIDPEAPQRVRDAINITFNPKGGAEGNGEGAIYTLKTLEEDITVPLILSDGAASPKIAVQALKIYVTENGEKPRMLQAEKKVYVLRTHSSSSAVPLGRVYVQHLGDGDSSAKKYEWKEAQPLFHLDPEEGSVVMLPGGRQGRYDLEFLVSDDRHHKKTVPAHVFVEVHSVPEELLQTAVPIVFDAMPDKLITEGQNGSALQRFEDLIDQEIKDTLNPSDQDSKETVLYKLNQREIINKRVFFYDQFFKEKMFHVVSMMPENNRGTQSKVYVASPDQINLEHFLLKRKSRIEKSLGFPINTIGENPICPTNGKAKKLRSFPCECDVNNKDFWIVEANLTSRISPKMNDLKGCNCESIKKGRNSFVNSLQRFQGLCYPNPCSNNGRCIPDPEKGFICMCDPNTEGRYCKILSRTFDGGLFSGKGTDIGKSFAWVYPSSDCNEGSISLSLLTEQKEAIVLFWGQIKIDNTLLKVKPRRLGKREAFRQYMVDGENSNQAINDNEKAKADGSENIREKRQLLSKRPTRQKPDLLVLELINGKPVATFHIMGAEYILQLSTSTQISDNKWHRIDLSWGNKSIKMTLDLCDPELFSNINSTNFLRKPDSPGLIMLENEESSPRFSPFFSSQSRPRPVMTSSAVPCHTEVEIHSPISTFSPNSPVSLGGFNKAFDVPRIRHWVITDKESLKGCIKNLRINKELKDLGPQLVSQMSNAYCSDVACEVAGSFCQPNAYCVGDPSESSCVCRPGWEGAQCNIPSQQTVTFHPDSSQTFKLKSGVFTYLENFQLRFRTRDLNGTLFHLRDANGDVRADLSLSDGTLCLQFIPQISGFVEVCVDKAILSDGEWHDVYASRHGFGNFLSIDGGDSDYYNSTISTDASTINLNDNVTLYIGGIPPDVGSIPDFQRGCISDVRIEQKTLPMREDQSENLNALRVSSRNVSDGCPSAMSCASSDLQCLPPLICRDRWGSLYCSCGPGYVQTENGTCLSFQSCNFVPCFNGGACLDTNAGYVCSCPSGFSGTNCEINQASFSGGPSSPEFVGVGVAAAGALILFGAFIMIFVRCFRKLVLRKRKLDRIKKADKKDYQNQEMTQNGVQQNGDGATRNGAEVSNQNGAGGGAATTGNNASADGGNEDLRNYAYEGQGSSPGSLSSCLESCSGSFKFMGGFREVAQMLDDSPPHEMNNSLDRKTLKTPIDSKDLCNSSITNNISNCIAPIEDVSATNKAFYPTNPTNFFNQNEKQLSIRKGPIKIENSARDVFYTISSSHAAPEAPIGFRNDS